MFQFENAKPALAATPIDARDFAEGALLSHRALLSWAEHCVECAPPACYGTCDLFEATPALKCRRFADGIVPNATAGGSPAGEVRFRKWAKLETQGNVAMLPVVQVDRYERLLTGLGAPIARTGAIARRLGGSDRWLTAGEALHKRINQRLERRARTIRPDVFVADVTNPGDSAVTLILTVSVDKLRLRRAMHADQLPPPATARLELPPGRSVREMDVAEMRPIFDSGLPFNMAIAPQDDSSAHLIFHRLDLGRRDTGFAERCSVAPAAAQTKAAKLVIFDLDNTLWRGVLLEGKVDAIPGLVELFRTLDERGILLSIASKNARDDAMARLAQEGLDDYLLHPQIGWLPKSEGVQRIVRALDIGADTVLFIDDNPFERAEVAEAVAGVEVLPETAIATLANHPRLQGAATPESRARRQMYREAIDRDTAAASYGEDYLTFLRSCDIRVSIRPDRADDFDRIAELVQRTNQLNFSGRKYSRNDIAHILDEPDRERHVVTCADKFGSYGTVGFALVQRKPLNEHADELVVDDFMLSCRVQGKFVEQAMLDEIAENGSRPVSAIRVNFRKTERNKAAQLVLEKLGFQPDEVTGGYRRIYKSGDFSVDFMTVERG